MWNWHAFFGAIALVPGAVAFLAIIVTAYAAIGEDVPEKARAKVVTGGLLVALVAIVLTAVCVGLAVPA